VLWDSGPFAVDAYASDTTTARGGMWLVGGATCTILVRDGGRVLIDPLSLTGVRGNPSLEGRQLRCVRVRERALLRQEGTAALWPPLVAVWAAARGCWWCFGLVGVGDVALCVAVGDVWGPADGEAELVFGSDGYGDCGGCLLVGEHDQDVVAYGTVAYGD